MDTLLLGLLIGPIVLLLTPVLLIHLALLQFAAAPLLVASLAWRRLTS
jgi:hypothetical protein